MKIIVCALNSLISDKNISTELATLYLTDYILKQMDNNLIIPMHIYFDLSKAFDTLDHTIVLKNYGTTETLVYLFRNYLTET